MKRSKNKLPIKIWVIEPLFFRVRWGTMQFTVGYFTEVYKNMLHKNHLN